jgi:hypothetical protein
MKSFFTLAILAVALALPPAAARAADTDAEVTAHQSVLDLAGAFTNDGFKLRDGDYAGNLKPGQATVIQVNLYAGNQYWFSAATSDPKTMLSISVYDENGKLVQTDPYSNANRVAAGYAPDTSGPYYVRIAGPADSAATYCLIYSYK